MKLEEAELCSDCEEVFNSFGGHRSCSGCGSENSVLIMKWIPIVFKQQAVKDSTREKKWVSPLKKRKTPPLETILSLKERMKALGLRMWGALKWGYR